MDSTSGFGQVSDPTLAALVPRRSSWRNLALLLAAVLTLVGVGWYGSSGLPTLTGNDASGTALSGGQVLVDVRLTAHGFPEPTLESITAPPWTSVVGAWVLDTDDPLVVGAASPDAAATRDALLSGERTDRELPQPLPTGREFDLVVLVDVVDCSRFPEDGFIPSREQWAAAHLRSAIGGTRTVLLLTVDGMLNREVLTSGGSCPD